MTTKTEFINGEYVTTRDYGDDLGWLDTLGIGDTPKKSEETWAQRKYNELMAKGKENWDEDDIEAYYYIEECWAEDARDAEYLDNFNVYY